MEQDDLNLVVVGHVDHGKSTVIGRLLADTQSFPDGKVNQVRDLCRRHSKPFEWAFLLDALKEERSQGITIDVARIHFRTGKRNYLILDAPGHQEFLKNMVTGAARADAALLVIDAAEGIMENSRRHGLLLSLLGVKQVAVLINKMDLADYAQEVFDRIRQEFSRFLEQLKIFPSAYIPVCASEGENLAQLSSRMQWYNGPTVLGVLDAFSCSTAPVDKPLRLPVQGVYKFTRDGDQRRIVAGTVETGHLPVGETVVFYPSGKKSVVQSLECFHAPSPTMVRAGQAAGFTLREQIYISRGEVAALAHEPPPAVAQRFKARLFWLGKSPLTPSRKYWLKVGTAKVEAQLEAVERVVDASTLEWHEGSRVGRHEVADCILAASQPIAVDLADVLWETSRFVLVDDFEISGGGVIQAVLPDAQTPVRDRVLRRNLKWETSLIPPGERQARHRQNAALVLVTGEKDSGKKPIARELEQILFQEGRLVYFMGISNLLYGVDADIKLEGSNNRAEHLRRLAEVSHLMLDAGLILIVTAVELTREDLELLHTVVNPNQVEVFWVGNRSGPGLEYAACFTSHANPRETARQMEQHLIAKKILL
jgi:bifunctional enzyme CysN/CysC